MDAKTLEALKASIAKWERNAVAETPDDYLTGPDDCPLCKLYFDNRCAGCPVDQRSGGGCMSTPSYRAAHSQWLIWKWLHRSGSAGPARAAAREEVAFLKSLLPEAEGK